MLATIFSELVFLKQVLGRYLIFLFLTFALLLCGTVHSYTIGRYTIPGIAFGSPSIAVELYHYSRHVLIPPDVTVVTLGPVAPFVAPIMIALLASLLLTFPVGLFLIGRFLFPALRNSERRVMFFALVPALLLFYGGAWFAYRIIIPETFSTLYAFAEPLGVQPFFDIADFLPTVFLLVVSVGLVFLLPLGMFLLSKIQLVPAYFWRAHWRGAVLTTIIFSAVVTPDGSGVSMLLLSGPILGLYFIGLLLAILSERHRVV